MIPHQSSQLPQILQPPSIFPASTNPSPPSISTSRNSPPSMFPTSTTPHLLSIFSTSTNPPLPSIGLISTNPHPKKPLLFVNLPYFRKSSSNLLNFRKFSSIFQSSQLPQIFLHNLLNFLKSSSINQSSQLPQILLHQYNL